MTSKTDETVLLVDFMNCSLVTVRPDCCDAAKVLRQQQLWCIYFGVVFITEITLAFFSSFQGPRCQRPHQKRGRLQDIDTSLGIDTGLALGVNRACLVFFECFLLQRFTQISVVDPSVARAIMMPLSLSPNVNSQCVAKWEHFFIEHDDDA